MLSGRPVEKRYSTRIILVRFPGASGSEHVLGLMVERADQGLTEPVGDLQSSGITNSDTPYLGKLATLGKETIQFVKIEHLIPDKLRDQLFTGE
jgi:chemotaxis-related protein WspB